MERLWYKIGETAQRIGVTPKDLRYWERIIPEIKPRRSQGNLRYYHVDEIPRLERIRDWLAEGLTVADCRELMRTGHLTRSLGLGLDELQEDSLPAPKLPRRSRPTSRDLAPILQALQSLLERLSRPVLPVTGAEPPESRLDPHPEQL